MYKLFCLISLCTFSGLCFSADFYGQAIHKNQIAAKEQAIADLQQNIYVNVESVSESYQTNTGIDMFSAKSTLSSSLPILGHKTDCYKKSEYFQCDSSLKTHQSSSLYISAIQEKQKIIDNTWHKTKNISSAHTKYDELTTLLRLIHEVQQLTLVLKMLSPEAIIPASPTITVTIKEELSNLEKTADSLSMATLLLTKNITQRNILIKPFLPYLSYDITPFSSALLTQLSSKVYSTNNESDALYTLIGKYRINKSILQIESQLINKKGEVINAAVVNLDKTLFNVDEYTPQNSNFEQMLLNGKIINQDFKVKITSNKGSRNLLFNNSESVSLMVKVNKPSYFYITGHMDNEKGKISYLLELNNSSTNERFIQYLGYDEVNRWVLLGEFEVKPPFGQESLQLIASTTKSLDLIPNTQYDGTYYRLQNSTKQAVTKTRGLVMKKTKMKKTNFEVAEAVLILKTVK